MRQLEAEMEALIEAVEVLARGLEGGPMAEPRNKNAEEAGRRAHELLLLAKSKAAGSTGVLQAVIGMTAPAQLAEITPLPGHRHCEFRLATCW